MSDPQVDIQGAIDALLDGHASDEQIAALEHWIAASPEHADRFAHQTLISGRLHMLMAFEPAATEPHPAALSMRPAGGTWRRWAMAAVLALCGIVGGLLMTTLNRSTQTAGSDESPAVTIAMITDVQQARWAQGVIPPQTGQSLEAQRIELEAGRVQMMFESGAVVDLLGPAVFEMIDRNQARLVRGQMLAWVPKRAVGFTVQTPGGRVVDLGTEFALRVNEAGASLLHVLSGRVQVYGVRDQMLAAGESVRYSATEVSAITAGDTAEFTGLLRPTRRFGYVHYSFDEPGGLELLDSGRHVDGETHNARIAWSKPGHEGPNRVTGRFGRALFFDGINDYVETDWHGPAGRSERTIAMWAKIANGVEPRHAFALLSYGLHEYGQAWQMSWNNDAQDGPLGVLRLGTSGQLLLGRTDLRDNQWHHLAATFDGTSLRLYVDGVLEAEQTASAEFNTADDEHAQTVQLGRNLVQPTYFRGAIDDVFIFDGALSATELVQLITADSPPTSDTQPSIKQHPGE